MKKYNKKENGYAIYYYPLILCINTIKRDLFAFSLLFSFCYYRNLTKSTTITHTQNTINFKNRK